MPRFNFLTILCAVLCSVFSTAQEPEVEVIEDIKVIIKTDKGNLHATIFASQTPITAANFLNLVSRDYYDGVGFHAKQPNFYLQGGDPTGTGRGMVGYFVENEIIPDLKHDSPGILSMARKKQPDTNGSQFFVTLAATPHLDGLYTIFGKITKGEELLSNLEIGDLINDIEIVDSAELLFSRYKKRISAWNRILDKRKDLKEEPEVPETSENAE